MNKILIVGSGAMACMFAARLAASGVRVSLLGTWKEGIAALNESGVRLETATATRTYPVQASHLPEDFRFWKYALVLVKSWQTERAAEQLKDILSEDGLAVTLQNGIGNLAVLQQHLGKRRAAQGITTAGATLLGPGQVRQVGRETVTFADHPGLETLVSMLERAGFQVLVRDQLESVIWEKLIINAAINPLSAILQVPNGRLLELPGARKLMMEAAGEVARLARILEIPISDRDPFQVVEKVAENTAENISSMLQDIRRGAPTEIEVISGAVVRQAKQVGLEVPINHTMLHLVRALSAAED